ncbi:unnamed protein product, partial [Discosporangium mesarthrocarpum]
MRGILSSNQRLARTVLWGGIAVITAVGLVSGPTAVQAAETASLPANTKQLAAPLPDILSKADRSRYRKIFAIQQRGDWRKADRLIKKLESRILMGHVLAQRYLHPTKYRSRYVELSRWM